MAFRGIKFVLSALAFAGAFFEMAAAPALQRVANTTLALPPEPPKFGYALTPAFPGLSFNEPVAIVSPPGETNRVFIVERRGTIQVITNLANPTKTVFLNLASKTIFTREFGCLGLAFHPQYRENGFIYVFYTPNTVSAAGGGVHDQLSRFSINPANTNQALLNSEVVILSQFDEADTHNSGDLHFGPDGYLYVALGDEGPGGNESDNAQRIDRDFFSAILRIDVDKRPGNLQPNPHPAVTSNYLVPSDNPFVGATSFNGVAVNPNAVRTEFWAVGFRNPWRMSFDGSRLFAGDVGQGQREEINVITRGGNYGWAYREGEVAYRGTPPASSSFINPIVSYRHMGASSDATREGNSVSAGIVYRGTKLDLFGQYIFGDYSSGHIWAVEYDGETASNFRLLADAEKPVAFGADPSNKDILIAEFDNDRILRLIFNSTSTGDPIPPTLSAVGAFSSLASLTPNAGIVPYEINLPFWSDNGIKSRWFSVPDLQSKIGFTEDDAWDYPAGMVWIKHFDLTLTNGQPPKRIETRFLVRNESGIYGVTYRWGNSTTDAVLVGAEGTNEIFTIRDGNTTRTQNWRYPARNECLICHNFAGGHALAFSSAQLNRAHNYGAATENQIRALSDAGYFTQPVASVSNLPVLYKPDDSSASLEVRARSYFSANCSQCHQPEGSAQGLWDARYSTPTAEAGIIDGPLINTDGDHENRVIKFGDLEHSMALTRISTLGSLRMPPLASVVLDTNAIALLTAWINEGNTPPGPRLSVARTGLNQIQLTWPAAEEPIALQAAGSLPTIGWSTITPEVSTVGSNRVATITLGATNSFYRLSR